MRHERRIVLTALLGAAPMAVTALVLVFSGDFPTSVRCLAGAVVVTSSLAPAYALYRQVSRRLLTFSNLVITALGVEDERFRRGSVGREGIAAEMVVELDALARLMESRTISTDEGAALLRTVVAQMTPRRLVVWIRWSAPATPTCHERRETRATSPRKLKTGAAACSDDVDWKWRVDTNR
jgi:hypothetical protein